MNPPIGTRQDRLTKGLIALFAIPPGGQSGLTLRNWVGKDHGNLTKVTGASRWRGGQGGRRFNIYGSMRFDAGGDYLSVSSTIWRSMAGKISIAMWFNANSFGSFKTLCDTVGSNSVRQCSIFINATNDMFCAFGSQNGGSGVPNPTWTLNEWQRICVTYDGATGVWTSFRNGIQNATGTLTTATTFSNELRFGTNPSGLASNWDGEIAGIAIYNRVLSPADVAAEYRDAAQGFPLRLEVMETLDGIQSLTPSPVQRNQVYPEEQSYLGNFMRGDYVGLFWNHPTTPDTAPTAKIYRSGTLLDTLRLKVNRLIEGRFTTSFLVNSRYTDSESYYVIFLWTQNGQPKQIVRYFHVSGGSGNSPRTALIEAGRNLGRAVVSVDDRGNAYMGYKPKPKTHLD